MRWYKSMRTCFGKLSRLPTGSGAQDLTERDEGILHKFSWLKTHISRQRGKQLGGLTEKLSTAAGPSTSERLSSGEDSDDDTCDVALAIQEDCIPSDVCHPQSCPPEVQSAPTSTTLSASKSKSKVRPSDSILKECVVESRRLQDKVETLLSEQDTSRDSQEQFGLFFTSMIPHIDEMMMIGRFTPNTDAVSASSSIIHIHIIHSHSSIVSLHSSISSIQLVSPIHHLSSRPSSLHYWPLNSNSSPCSSWVCWHFLLMCAQCQQVSLVTVERTVHLRVPPSGLALHFCPAHQLGIWPLQLLFWTLMSY